MPERTFFTSALLVEDEANLAIALEIALKRLGIPCSHASTLEMAREFLARSSYDFILLDRNLPDGDGLTLCTSLRGQGFTGAILILTAAGQTQARVEGLNQGADDYLPKPFSWEELEARICALGRRRPATPPGAPVSQAGEGGMNAETRNAAPWILDEARLRVLGPRGWVELTPLEFKLAAHLIGSRGTIVTRDALLKEVWGFTLLPKTRTVDHFLGRLRKHFEENPDNPRHFLTVRGAGYRFEP